MKKINFVKAFVIGIVTFVAVSLASMAMYNYGTIVEKDSPEVEKVIMEVDSLPATNARVSDLLEVKDSTGSYKPVQMLYYETDEAKRVIQLNLEKKWWKYHIVDYVVK